MSEVKQEVREFYDRVGWMKLAESIYQNARYEDLRPVSRRYIHDCHMRVARHIESSGRFFLDAGSGPIQYPEYLEYSRGYEHRVCADISMTALGEARNRIGEHGLFVVADIANLPFKEQSFEGIVSLHTIHHLAEAEQQQAYLELHRVLASQRTAVVVNGWSHSAILAVFEPLIRAANWIRNQVDRVNRQNKSTGKEIAGNGKYSNRQIHGEYADPKGTYTSKHDRNWLEQQVASHIPVEIFVWRTVSVRFLRALIHPKLGGSFILKLLYALEERFPRFFGESGKYPLILIHRRQEDD
jgi:ubiquinone/menaquinone biosynthesis C-methylase UbiE